MDRAPLDLLAVVTGRVVPIELVPDPAFSEKMVGDGIAIEPDREVVTAPCAGRVVQLHRSKHAYGLEAATGARVLIHVGLDTVELKGEGFSPRVKEGQSVKAGQTLVEFDRAVLKRRGMSPLTVLVVENMDEHPVTWRQARGALVRGGVDRVLRLGGVVPPDASEEAARPGEDRTPSGSKDRSSAAAVVKVGHAEGLHARPAAQVATAARRFRAAVEVRVRGKSANARSPLALMGLAVHSGEEVEVIASGPDAAEARDAIAAAIETAARGPVRVPEVSRMTHAADPALGPFEVAGIVASRGVAVGATALFRRQRSEPVREGKGEARERAELERALREAAADIEEAIAAARRRHAMEESAILEAHRAFLEDPEIVDRAMPLLEGGASAGYALSSAVEAHCRVLENSGSALLAERVADLRDLERQVLTKLGGKVQALPELPAHALLIAEDLSPGELAELDSSRLAGIVLERGGPTSHVSIVARSRDIPALVATGPALRLVPDAQQAVLDGERGVLCFQPAPEAIDRARARIACTEVRRREARRSAAQPAVTRDGIRVEVAANVSRADEAAAAASMGADGVGLLRTELLFLERETAPSEEEQRVAYQAVVDALGGRMVIIRTLDVGADKQLAYLPLPREDNPALGLRGVRLGLSRKELLAEQLRACLRVRPLDRIRLMLPMVTDLGDVRSARAVLQLEAATMGVAAPQLGIMVETPAAALLADKLSTEVDFLSLGTNDLTQYTLAMDRGNPAVASRVDALHPAVLRLVAAAATGAVRHGRWIGVCGGMAGDPLAVPLLLGLGISELSVEAVAVADVKALVRRLQLKDGCTELAQRTLELSSAEEVRELVRSAWAELEARTG